MSSGRDLKTRAGNLSGIAPYVGITGAMVLAWQIGLQPLVQRAPVEAAIRLAPASPEVLSRAAEAEMAAGRNGNAASLARDALARSPYDVRALRVVGLTDARAGRINEADEILTLAGNWSLRDDPTHGWLVERRLRQGNYSSAFAHADALARRREEHRPGVFNLFTTAVQIDPKRAYPVLARLLSARPSWREAYLAALQKDIQGLPVAANLAILLDKGPAPFTNAELRQLYLAAVEQGQVQLVTLLRDRLNRPPKGALLANGDFSDPDSPEPFQWVLAQAAGASAIVTADDLDPGNTAVRVEYDGYSAATVLRQQIFLRPGAYRFTSASRVESGQDVDRLEWVVSCVGSGSPLLRRPAVVEDSQVGEWNPLAAGFTVPAGCMSQQVELRGKPEITRSQMVVWFDRTAVNVADREGAQ